MHQLSPGPGFLGQELEVPKDVSLVLLPLTFIPLNQQEWAAARAAGARNAFFLSRMWQERRQQHHVILPGGDRNQDPAGLQSCRFLPLWLQFLDSVYGSFPEVSGMLFCGENPCALSEGQRYLFSVISCACSSV